MYSAYLFLAFIFGRTLVVRAATVDAALTITVEDQENDVTKDSIKIKAADGGSGTGASYAVNRYATADTTQIEKQVGTAMDALPDTGLKSGTTYYYKIIKTVSGSVTESTVYDFTTLFDELPGVTVEKVESTSATFKWENFDTYKDTSVKVDTAEKPAPTEETYELKDLKPSTKSEVSFQGFTQDDNGKEQKHIICTAPSKPTITKKIESTTATTPVHTLTLTIKFADGEKVSSLDFVTGVDLIVAPTCDDCTSPTLTISDKKKFTAELQSDANEVVVVLGEYPEANAATDIQVTAKFDSDGGCNVAKNIGVMETTMNSVATLANKQAMLVYLAIGTMATVLRLLGMEVWTPIGLL